MEILVTGFMILIDTTIQISGPNVRMETRSIIIISGSDSRGGLLHICVTLIDRRGSSESIVETFVIQIQWAHPRIRPPTWETMQLRTQGDGGLLKWFTD